MLEDVKSSEYLSKGADVSSWIRTSEVVGLKLNEKVSFGINYGV